MQKFQSVRQLEWKMILKTQIVLSRRKQRSGVSLIYIIIGMAVLLMFASLAVDLGRAQLVKTELRRVADAASRYGAASLSSGNVSTVQANAIDAANDNTVDGATFNITNSDIEFGTWSTTSKTLTVLSGSSRSSANAIRITARMTSANNNALPMTFAQVLGRRTLDIEAQSTAMYVPAVNVSLNVPATSCPWLAGAGSGTSANVGNPHNNPDYAPAACPKLMSGVPLTAGQSLQFDSINGGAGNDPAMASFTPDGNPNDVQGNWSGAENGLSNMICPLNSVVGVFLDDNVPSTQGSPPSTLDFGNSTNRDFASLSPQLRQVFFIGDGLRNDGTTKQNFVVPSGTTRLFIGTMDGWEWNNNYGSFTTTVTRPAQVQLVK